MSSENSLDVPLCVLGQATKISYLTSLSLLFQYSNGSPFIVHMYILYEQVAVNGDT